MVSGRFCIGLILAGDRHNIGIQYIYKIVTKLPIVNKDQLQDYSKNTNN
jgi:hypothetical protein